MWLEATLPIICHDSNRYRDLFLAGRLGHYHGLEIKGRQPESLISRLSPRKFLDTYS